MKYLLLFIIRVYWFLIPESKRRQCIFRKSCSNYVYEETSKKGLKSGLEALLFRYECCRPNYHILNIENQYFLITRNSIVIQEKDINSQIFNKNM